MKNLHDLLATLKTSVHATLNPDLRLSGKSVFLINGFNEENSQEILQKVALKEFDFIVFLDVKSLNFLNLRAEKVEYLFIDDIFSADKLNILKSFAFSLEDQWSSCVEFPEQAKEIVSYDLLHYRKHFQELLLEISLYSLFEKSNIRELIYLKHIPEVLSLNSDSNYAFGSILESLKFSTEIVIGNSYRKRSLKKLLVKLLKQSICRVLNNFPKANFLSQKPHEGIVICHSRFFSYSKDYIFDSLIDEKIALIIITDENSLALARKFPSQFYSGRMISAIDSAVFLTEATGLAMVESFSSSVREAYCAGSYLDMQFFDLFNERMIVLKKMETFYSGILSAFPKVKVIVPNLLDGHSQTVRRLCMKMNVELVVLPHGFLGYAPRSGYIYGRYHVGSIFSVHALNSQRFPRDRITLCRKVDSPREYPVASHQSTIAGWKTNKFRVLIVFDPASDTDKRFAVSLSSHIGLSAQLRGLKACSSLIDFCDVDVLFKPHPSIPEHELYHLADPRILSRCLPPLADLFYFADKADLVVCLNYLGVALKHLSQLRKPIIHFVTSARIGYFSNMGHDFDSAPLLDAGMVVREPSELVEAVHRCTLDANTLDRLRSQSDQFYKAWFDTFELES